ncbi:hypothetical protein Poly30_45120 [Planctomycetes bacterium Poly30]|uniref:Uncharacterized protein n=1 Tax=Saltatorellus ferox TaxID=2528018 RepID=A0A518EXY4_9BACT|nr:hypothetical protein Poly30_45120 [Planctomycetes bacterium Poly30]
MKRFLRTIGLAALVLVLLFGVLEGGYRAYLAVTGEGFSSRVVRDAWLGQLDWIRRPHGPIAMGAVDLQEANEDTDVPRVGTPVLSPYMGIDLLELLDQYQPSAEYFATPESEDVFDVVLLGGSVAMLMGEEKAAQERFEATLAADPRLAGRQVRLHNQARAGTKAPQTSILCHLLFQLGWKPDLVVLLDGFNEVALANENRYAGAHPLYPPVGTWSFLTPEVDYSAQDIALLVEMELAQRRSRKLLEGGLRSGLYRSAFGARVLDALLSRPGARHAGAKAALSARRNASGMPVALRGPELPGDTEAAFDGMIQFWAQSAIAVDAICRAHGVPLLHVLQPTLHDEGAKPMSEQEKIHCRISTHWEEGVDVGYPRLRAEGERLRERGVHFVDGSRLFAKSTETLYRDACHFFPPGSIALAEFLASSAAGLDEMLGEER